jgi:hypothetical protein
VLKIQEWGEIMKKVIRFMSEMTLKEIPQNATNAFATIAFATMCN